MDIVDRDLMEAELEAASPPPRINTPETPGSTSEHHHRGYLERDSHEIERVATSSTSSSTSSTSTASSGNLTYRTIDMSRVSTQADLERHPTELSRIATARSQHSATVGRTVTSRRVSRKPLPPFGAGKAYPPPLPDQEEYVVEFDGQDDPLHPHNWPLKRKVLICMMLGYTTMVSVFASSIISPATMVLAETYNIPRTAAILGVAAFVLGFAFGPTFWAPLSELKGRRLPLVVGMFGFTLFEIATATANDIQTIIICRFFGGLFGACPLAVVAAVFSDMFDNRTRGVAVTIFAMTVFTGPMLAPFIGGYIVESHLGWRWTQYLVAIMGGCAFVLDFFFLRETYAPVILVGKAAELRRRTLNWGIHAKQEEIEVDIRELVNKNFSRPMRLLFGEPIVLLLSIYMAFIYGLLYLFLTAYPVVFQQVHGFGLGQSGLPFFGMLIGQVIAGIVVLLQQPWYERKLAANNGIPVPEWRLPSVMAGGIAFAAGIFWFGWTGYRPDIHWAVPTASGLLTGFGLMSIFLQSLNYLVDAYLMFAASAIAGNTFLRSLCGAGFPLFAGSMFDGLGIQWASTLLGCVAAVLAPIPIFFYVYGPRIRARSHFAPAADLPQNQESDVDDEKRGQDAV